VTDNVRTVAMLEWFNFQSFIQSPR